MEPRCLNCTSQELVLEVEEAVLTTNDLCSSNVERRPYGELGSVSRQTECGCCASVTSGLGLMKPGWGCDEELVDELVRELKARMQKRGDTAQIKRAEEQIDMTTKLQNDVNGLDAKIDAIMKHLNIAQEEVAPVVNMER